MAIDVNENILWLQVAVQNVLRVNVFETQQNFCEVETGLRLGKPLLALEEVEEFPSRAKVRHEVHALPALEGPVQLQNKGMIEQTLHNLEFVVHGFETAFLGHNELL